MTSISDGLYSHTDIPGEADVGAAMGLAHHGNHRNLHKETDGADVGGGLSISMAKERGMGEGCGHTNPTGGADGFGLELGQQDAAVLWRDGRNNVHQAWLHRQAVLC